ncbi:2OG-Fe(II) oxygenase [Nocardia heshunensis]
MSDQTVRAIGELLAGAGAFATRGSVAAEDLSIAVDGVGALAWPVSAEQARALCAVADPARYGLREQTLVDPNVRDTWEVSRGLVAIDQVRWGRTLGPMVEAVRADLGLPAHCELSAELHSMLVYEAGQFFVRHQDSEKADGMIGTLVVTLPSEFSGGELVVEHRGEQVSDEGATDGLGFVAFYADCAHEVRPVVDGYRIALTYNLIAKGSTAPRVDGSDAAVGALAGQLREHFATPVPVPSWRRNGGPESALPQRLVYFLDHQYSQRGLAWDRLKGGDASRVATLVAAAVDAGCATALVLAEIRRSHAYERFEDEEWMCGRHRRWEFVEGAWQLTDEEWESIDGEDEPFDDAPGGHGEPADHPDRIEPEELGEASWSAITLTWQLDRSGNPGVSVSTHIANDELCTDPMESPMQPFAMESEGYMGNEGNTVDHWYRRAAIMICPA